MNFSFMFPHGRSKPTETEICLFAMMLVICALGYQIVKTQIQQEKQLGHIRNIAIAVYQSAQREIARSENEKSKLKIPHVWLGPHNKSYQGYE